MITDRTKKIAAYIHLYLGYIFIYHTFTYHTKYRDHELLGFILYIIPATLIFFLIYCLINHFGLKRFIPHKVSFLHESILLITILVQLVCIVLIWASNQSDF